MTCNQQWVSFQVDREPVVGQGELKMKLKDDGLLKCKKRKVSKETIVESKTEAEVVVMTAEPEARPWSKMRTGPARVLSNMAERSGLSQALWSITADLQAI